MVYLGTSITAGNRGGSVDNVENTDRNGGSNGHTSEHNRSSTENRDHGNESSGDEGEGQIRVGKDYQISPPDWIPPEQRKPEQCPERALLVWSPCPSIGNVDEYIQISKEKYGYNAEQALGMLFWHKHDLDRAIQDLANFTPFPDEWSVEDKVLFEQAFQFHGKSFHRIRQMLPDKSIAQLVKYYYSWKKTRQRTSLMDRQARKLQAQREETSEKKTSTPTPTSASTTEDSKDKVDNKVENSSNNKNAGATPAAGGAPVVAETPISDDEDMVTEDASKPRCSNCGILCHVTHATTKGEMCGTCHQYFNRTGQLRPTTGPARKDGSKAGGTQKYNALLKNSGKPPKGMYINHDDLVSLATGPSSQGEQLLKSMDREIVTYKRTVQNNKQILSSLTRRNLDKTIEPYRIPDASSKLNAKWSQEEQLLGVQGVRKFGKNFATIAEVIGTKTESHVRSFFVNYRRRYNLDNALKEYEAEHGPSGIETPPAEEGGVSGSGEDSNGSTADQVMANAAETNGTTTD